MDTMIDFVTANAMWFIIGGVVIVMAIIGYFVDKSDFGRNKEEKEVKPKQEKVKKEKPVKKEKIKIENKGLNDLTQPTEVVENETPTQEVKEEDLFTPLSTEVNAELGKEEIDESLFAPLDTANTNISEEPIDLSKDNSINETNTTEEQPKTEEDVWKF